MTVLDTAIADTVRLCMQPRLPVMQPVCYVLRDPAGDLLAVLLDPDTVSLDTPVRRLALLEAVRLDATVHVSGVPVDA